MTFTFSSRYRLHTARMTSHARLFRTLFCLICLTIASSAMANDAETIEPRYQAMARLRLGDPAGACDTLDTSYPVDTADEQILYLRARCNAETKNYAQAEKDYLRLLELRPDATRAQMELGQLYAATGKLQEAKRLYGQVVSAQPPQNILSRLEEAMTILDAQKNWYLRTEAGVIFDSNINSGLSTDQIIAFDRPFTLGTSFREQEAAGYLVNAEGGYSHALSASTSLIAQGSVNHTDYFDGGDFDLNTLQLSAGPAFQGGKWKAVLQPNVSWQTYGDDTYRTAYGATGRTTYQATAATEMGMSLLAQQAIYPTVTGRKSFSVTASPDVTHRLGHDLTSSFGLILRKEDADDSIYSNTAWGLRAGLTHQLYTDVRANYFYQYLNADYDGRQPAFGNLAREEQQHIGTLRLDWDISRYTSPGLNLSARYQYIKNDANIRAYAFDRQAAILALGKSW